MFLGSPVDADGCLVGKWRTNIHKHVIAVGMETAESALALVIESCAGCS
jgi:hypothetical protein